MPNRHKTLPVVFPDGLNIPTGWQPIFGRLIHEAWKHAQHWLCNMQQLFTFTGPGPYAIPDEEDRVNDNPDYGYSTDYDTPSFAIILHAPPKADTSDPNRQLGGLVVPWRYVVEWTGDVITGIARITWTEDSVTRTLWQSRSDSVGNDDINCESRDMEQIQLYKRLVDLSHGDNNCQRTDTDYWDEGGDETLSKGGTSADRYLTVTNTSGVNQYQYAQWPASGTLPSLHDGSTYRIWGQIRSDGDTTPLIWCDGGTVVFTGTTSTDWQPFDETFVMDGNYLRIGFDMDGMGEAYYSVDLDFMFINELGAFDYEPESSGGFTYGLLAYERMMIAGLGVFSLPGGRLTDDQMQIDDDQFNRGKAIRGYSGSGATSWGDLMHLLGDGQSDDADDLERLSRRCVMQWGHPTGVAVNATSYTNIQAGENSWFMCQSRAVFGGDADDCVNCRPAIVAKTMYGGTCYVKITNSVGSNESEVAVSATSWTLYDPDDFDLALPIYKNHDIVKVELKAATGDCIAIKTVALFEDSEL